MFGELEALEKQGNRTETRLQAFLRSIKELAVLENEASYRDMLQETAAVAERVITGYEGSGCMDEAALSEYIRLCKDVKREFSKYQVGFIGCADKAAILSDLVDREHVHVLGFGEHRNRVPDYCDYVMILDPNGAPPDLPTHCKAIRLDKILLKLEISPETYYYDMKHRESSGRHKGYVTGLSYEQRGLIFEGSEGVGFGLGCMANASQDLFVNIRKYMNIYNETKEKYHSELKYCVFGMNFYTLWYDLSLSDGAIRMLCFYDRIKTLHHLKLDVSGFFEDMDFCKEVFSGDFLDRYYKARFKACIEGVYEKPDMDEYHPERTYEDDRMEIEKVFHKPYEHTFAENTGMVRRFFKWLNLHNIQAIVYMPPFPRPFNEHTPAAMKERTLAFLKELKEEFDFEILDISEGEGFDNSCFADWCHLNAKGAKKATELLNAFMEGAFNRPQSAKENQQKR